MDDKLRPKDAAEEAGLFRAQVIGPLLCRGALERGALADALRDLSRPDFRPPGPSVARTYSVPTLERWLHSYRDGAPPSPSCACSAP